MRLKYVFPILFLLLTVGVFCITASEHDYITYTETPEVAPTPEPQQRPSSDRRMVDMIADDSYFIDKGDSTIFILVGNFAAHHNGAVILADSAVRYSNQNFECFGNVLINQNSTYAYGDRATYNRIKSSATIYSDLVKVVDGDAVMYTYNCTFDTAKEVASFTGGCYVEKGESLMESDRAFYYTKSHELIAVDKVEMRDETYQMTGDSVIFNTKTEDAKYFTNTNIWNNKDEYLFANQGTYTKSRDLHYLTRDAYILSPEREIWSDTLEYCKAEGHIVCRNNIQIDDTEQKILGFADYGEWWDEPGNALFTRRPSMINYNTEEGDSIFLAADTMWMYTIAVLPPSEESDTTATEEKRVDEQPNESLRDRDSVSKEEHADSIPTEETITEEPAKSREKTEDKENKPNKNEKSDRGDKRRGEDNARQMEGTPTKDGARQMEGAPTKEGTPTKDGARQMEGAPTKDGTRQMNGDINPIAKGAEAQQRNSESAEQPMRERTPDTERRENMAAAAIADHDSREAEEVMMPADTTINETIVTDSIAADTTAVKDTIVLTEKQLRKIEQRRVRDSIRDAERAIRDSIDSIKQREEDSIRHIRDSLLKIKVDSIIAKRIAQSSRIADEEAARIARIKQKSVEREHRKIDKAKARAARRGKEYKGPDYTIDSMADSTAMESMRDNLRTEATDTMARDSINADSLGADSLAVDTTNIEPPFPADSTYKMIKAYRRVRMYRSDMQLISDSLVILNTDSVIRLYRDPILWNESSQITADSMAIHTRNEVISKAHFMGDPLMGSEIDTMYYNQVKGKEMIAHFADGKVYRNDVNGNAQTIYYLQDDGNSEVTALMYIESSGISFYLDNGEMDKITYKQNPEYVIYPLGMVPETQKYKLDNFEWHESKRPLRDSVVDRTIRPTRREDAAVQQKPRFRITERINYDRRRLTENRMWVDRVDELSPDIVEWRDSRTSAKKKR